MTTRNEYIKHIWFDFQSSISFISLIDMIVCARVCVRVRGHARTQARLHILKWDALCSAHTLCV